MNQNNIAKLLEIIENNKQSLKDVDYKSALETLGDIRKKHIECERAKYNVKVLKNFIQINKTGESSYEINPRIQMSNVLICLKRESYLEVKSRLDNQVKTGYNVGLSHFCSAGNSDILEDFRMLNNILETSKINNDSYSMAIFNEDRECDCDDCDEYVKEVDLNKNMTTFVTDITEYSCERANSISSTNTMVHHDDSDEENDDDENYLGI